MKNILLLFALLSWVIMLQGQVSSPHEKVVITSKKKKTLVRTDKNGILHVNVSPKDLRKFKLNGLVRYSDFGARGDGKTDDIDAIAATHAFANHQDLLVKADEGATYYIGGKERTAIIQTNTDFGSANFIIDDTEVQNRQVSVFMVTSSQQPFHPEGISTLKRNQEKIDTPLPGTCLITVTNSKVKHYIRFGLNQNNGSAQTDIFVVDKNGWVDMDAPIIWDFDQISDITALPIDNDTLTITGGLFTTIANRAVSKYTYYSRNLAIRRSNVLVDGLEHRITGEGDHGAPYGGFINIRDCSYVTVRNTILTGHKTYRTIGAAGKPVSMGSYDLSVNRALNVSFINCKQTNDIDDRTYWGILGSNYCKNLLYDHCTFSRFDAHKGVANATIRNSTLGHMGINAIGSGILTVENTTIRGRSLINLRRDYGSTWQGEFVIRNCVFVPAGGRPTSASLIGGSYSGQHDFGYTCYMPERITIESLHIDDSNHPEDYQGPAIFANINPQMTGDSYEEKFPYIKTREVILRNVTTASGKKLRVSDNLYMFKDVKIDAKNSPIEHAQEFSDSPSEKRSENKKWLYYHNLRSDSLKYLYDQNSVKILADGEVITGRPQILDNYLSNSMKLISIKTDTAILANAERAIEYEMSENIYENGDRRKNLVIWQTRNDMKMRVFEFSSKVEKSGVNLSEIDQRRKLWIDLCNKHNAKNLINELYTENTLYYNHRPVVKGRAALIEEYQYMNNKNYELSLQPLVVDPVNPNLVFEIGQCSGSYPGKYIIIWRKDEDGKWRIFIDSNI